MGTNGILFLCLTILTWNLSIELAGTAMSSQSGNINDSMINMLFSYYLYRSC
jgi:hypothetical protein